MFGLAVWDARRRQLLLARDRVGKKPLFYAERAGVLSFASELNALLGDAQIDRELDPRALDSYLTFLYVPAPLSAFRGVRKLPPATTLVYRRGRVSIDRYWRLDYSSKRPPVDRAELHAELRDTLRRGDRGAGWSPTSRWARSSREASIPRPSWQPWRRHRRAP